YQEGFFVHAAPDTLVPKAAALIGPWVAATRRASASGRSDAKCFTIASVDRVMNPCLSTIGAASAGGGGGGLAVSPANPPPSRPKAANENEAATLGDVPQP